MVESGVRLRFSGFVIFVSRLLSVVTGLVFQLMITRSVTVQDYGVWFNVSDVTAYFTILAGVFPFWVFRFAARNKSGAIKTGLVANFTIAVVAALIYIAVLPSITFALNVGQEYRFLYLLAGAYIIVVYLLYLFESCLQARMPHTLGYGLLMAEVCKVILGAVLVLWFRLSLLGALLSIIAGTTIQLLYYFKLLINDLREPIAWSYVKEWLKGSVANIYNIVGAQLSAFIFILLFVYGGEASRGYYGAAAQIASIISYSTYLAYALYPRLLAGGGNRDITTSLNMVLMFAVPMVAGALTLPNSFLMILKADYADAWPVLVILALDAFFASLTTTLSYVLYGLERFDEKATISLRELVKSKLFISFTLPYIQSAISLPAAYYVLAFHTGNQPLLSAISVATLYFISRFISFLILCKLVNKAAEIKMREIKIAKYLLASVIMAAILHLLPPPTRLSLTLGVTGLGALIYLLILTIVDPETRSTMKLILRRLNRNDKSV